jgi:hypothetical protein
MPHFVGHESCPGRRARLLVAGAVKRVAILAGVTIVKMPRPFLATLAGLFRHQALGAMGKPLELEGRRCLSGQQAHADATGNEDHSFHGFYLQLQERKPST